MTPKLPPNSWTITNTNPDCLDVRWLKDIRNMHRDNVIILIDNQLDLLNRYDSYHRKTCPQREITKQILNIKKCQLKG